MDCAILESLMADSACEPEVRFTAAGRAIWALPTDQQFSVDPEAALLISEFELDRLLETPGEE
ncbi:hypothetical protein AWV79_26865 [Cupriavidus sp. UYMMa02A]|nr:hypothetical protein AWV79_26865 [Cupriavidus sp. UYMMa02A]